MSNTITAVVGCGFGDEGKGRIVDYLSQSADMVMRYQGGGNAGHTIVNDRGKFILHHIPSGIFNPYTICYLGPGMVINLEKLVNEIESLEYLGVKTDNIRISSRAHIVTHEHIMNDDPEGIHGTTKQGIGPCYTDKVARNGLRIGDIPNWNNLPDYIIEAYEKLEHLIVDQTPITKGSIILEGQLGVMRDLNWGIYPWVTSSSVLPGGNTGLKLSNMKVIGVTKAYVTKVGAGGLPTKMFSEVEEVIQKKGNEFGATTGRLRECGWLDLVALKYACEVSGADYLALTKIDVLDGMKSLEVCEGYKRKGKMETTMKAGEDSVPFYYRVSGWDKSAGITRFGGLPAATQNYVFMIEDYTGVPVRFVSTGPERESIIVR